MRYCPQCKSPEIESNLPGFLNTYKCRKCGYIGTLIIENE